MIDQFRKSWLVHCQKRGITKCWVSIDGSNNDCEVRESDLSEYGYAKSGNDSKIVSFIYAVNAEDGTPITYYVNPGSVIDSKAFMEIAALLKVHPSKLKALSWTVDSAHTKSFRRSFL